MTVQITPVGILPEISKGDDIATHIICSLKKQKPALINHDILCVAQKIVSKSEGQVVRLAALRPSSKAQILARKLNKDPRHVQVILNETKRIVRTGHGVIICETHHGFVCANAGVDLSNVDGGKSACLLPINPDNSAKKLRKKIQSLTGKKIAIIITDTFGRPWREGLTEVAIGISGMNALVDLRGQKDTHGYSLKGTVLAIADSLAAAAGLAMGKTSRTPVALIRGFKFKLSTGSVSPLLRRPLKDLFR